MRFPKTSVRDRSAVALALTLVATIAAAGGIKTTVQRDEAYNFGARRTWAWHPEGRSAVHMLQTLGDATATLERNAPVIEAAIDHEMARRGFRQVPAERADFYVAYHVMVGPEYTSQYRGQFIGRIPAWGLPDFVQATTSLKVVMQGSVVIDVTAVELKALVWRGVAGAEVDGRVNEADHDDHVRRAVAQLLKAFPPKDRTSKK